jgi:hypothetical protein
MSPKITRIALDLDNTIVLYDSIFRVLAKEKQLAMYTKTALRDYLRGLPGGDLNWQKVQLEAYGRRLNEAQLAPGFEHFVLKARAQGVKLWVISHKSAYAAIDVDRTVNIREAMNRFLESRHFFEAPLSFGREDLFYTDTREQKIAKLVELRAEVLVDDLIEVFEEPSFPSTVEKFFYCPSRKEPAPAGPTAVESWAEIEAALLGPGV